MDSRKSRRFHLLYLQRIPQRLSERTKAALAAAKAQGKKLGTAGPANLKRNLEERTAQADAFAEKLRSVLDGFKADGLTQVQQVAKLNELGVTTPRGGLWSRMQLQRVMQRLEVPQ